jgi:hypothetical protein
MLYFLVNTKLSSVFTEDYNYWRINVPPINNVPRDFAERLRNVERESDEARRENERLRNLLIQNTTKLNQAESTAMKNASIAKITGASVGATAGIGCTIVGIFLCFLFPPIGIPLTIVGVAGTTTGATFSGINGHREASIKKILSVHPNLTYNHAATIFDKGHIELGNTQNHLRYRYTATTKNLI